jgi:hypothetical protein
MRKRAPARQSHEEGVMSKRKQDKGKQPPWISVFRHTWKSGAWQALSVGARALYVELAANYNTKMQNAVFLSARTGAGNLNTRPNNIMRWLLELEHYGFTVKIQGAYLGSDGEGKSARYRLTDRWYAGKEPTYDFQNWTGVLFDPPKRKANAAEIARLNELNRSRKKQKPVTRSVTPRNTVGHVSELGRRNKNGNKRNTVGHVSAEADRNTVGHITSLAIPQGERAPMSEKPKLQWSTPVLTEVFGEEAALIRRQCGAVIANPIDELAAVRRRHEELLKLVEASRSNGRMH